MTPELQKKVERAVKLIQSAGAKGNTVEVAYSGGKDSDVILELAKMSGINFRAIYKNTTIDPPGTIAHVKANGAEIVRPEHSFFELIAMKGLPNRFSRYCCQYLKEYKIENRVVMGVRKAESYRRKTMYNEPTECRKYNNSKTPAEVFYPILDWNDFDVVEFIEERGVKVHSLYYREDGTIDPKRRLGCMCCPLAGHQVRISYFKKFPNMVKAYIRAAQLFLDNHPHTKSAQRYTNAFEWFWRDVFCYSQKEYEESKQGLFGLPDYKGFLEQQFGIKFHQS